MKLVGQGERVNGEASRRGEKTKKKRKRESGLVVDKVRRTANDSNSPIYHSPLSPGEEGRREKRNFEFPNRATKYVRTRFNVNYEFELFFRTICFFDAVNFREIRVEKKKTSRGKFRCASCWKRSFERTLVTDLIISIAVSSDRPTRDENV